MNITKQRTKVFSRFRIYTFSKLRNKQSKNATIPPHKKKKKVNVINLKLIATDFLFSTVCVCFSCFPFMNVPHLSTRSIVQRKKKELETKFYSITDFFLLLHAMRHSYINYIKRIYSTLCDKT